MTLSFLPSAYRGRTGNSSHLWPDTQRNGVPAVSVFCSRSRPGDGPRRWAAGPAAIRLQLEIEKRNSNPSRDHETWGGAAPHGTDKSSASAALMLAAGGGWVVLPVASGFASLASTGRTLGVVSTAGVVRNVMSSTQRRS